VNDCEIREKIKEITFVIQLILQVLKNLMQGLEFLLMVLFVEAACCVCVCVCVRVCVCVNEGRETKEK
jgi:hypothetical protein